MIIQLPIAILYLTDFLPITNQVQMESIDKLVVDLETAFDIKHQKVSLAAKWKESAPKEVRGSTIQEYLKDVSNDLPEI